MDMVTDIRLYSGEAKAFYSLLSAVVDGNEDSADPMVWHLRTLKKRLDKDDSFRFTAAWNPR